MSKTSAWSWCATLRTSFSGTFLQTRPELITPLKGHSLFLRICPPTLSAPSEKDYGSNIASAPSLISLMVSVDVKHHVYLLNIVSKHRGT